MEDEKINSLNELIIGDKIYKVKSLGGDGKDILIINYNTYEVGSGTSFREMYKTLSEKLKGYYIIFIDTGVKDLIIKDYHKLDYIEQLEAVLNKLKKEVNVE